MEEINLNNFGVLIDKINDKDFKKIKKECLSKDKVPYTTGISSNQIADHYELIKTREILFEFLRKKITEYDQRYNYFKSIKTYSKSKQELIFTTPWYNVQKPGQYLSNHFHDGLLSYTMWVDIPFAQQEGNEDNEKYNSCFELLYTNIVGQVTGHKIFIDKSYEGKMIMFPSTLLHCVYPFYKAKKNRVSIAGNVLIK
jgi:hypothetical protein